MMDYVGTRRPLAAMLVLVALAASPAVALDEDPTWGPRETVWEAGDHVLHLATDRFLAYDHHGVPGVACAVRISDYINLRRRVPNLGWSTMINSGVTSTPCPTHAYDRHERPAICHVDPDNTTLVFSSWDGTQWDVDNILTNAGSCAAMAYDLYGRAAIAYTANSDSSVRYICDTDGDNDWADETSCNVFSGFTTYGDVKLAFDPLNRPVVAYWASFGGGDSKTIFISAQEGSYWPLAEVDYVETSELRLSLAVDQASGYAGLAYANDRSELTYAYWDGDEWLSEKLGGGMHPSLAFDPADGAPVIACTGKVDGLNLYYWDSDDGKWAGDLVDGEAGFGFCPSLAFNPYGDDPFGIAYFDSSGNVYYIQDPPVVPEPATLALLGAGLGTLLARHRRRNRVASGAGPAK